MAGRHIPGTSITTVMARMAAYAPADEIEALSFWRGMALAIHAVEDQFTEQGAAFDAATNAARVGLDGGAAIPPPALSR